MAPSTGPRYRTWVRISRLAPFAVVSVVSLAGCLLAFLSPWFLLFLVPLGIFGYITLILGLTVYRLGPGGYQRRIHELIATTVPLPPGGRALDVGCGSGSLVVKIAKAHPTASVTGVDSWGGSWEYSRDQCLRNARLEGAGERVSFEKQNGAALTFPGDTFDAVVSCMTFHEIKENPDRADGVAEALRVLCPGGAFYFLDLFGDPAFYPAPGKLRALTGAEPRPLTDLMPLPFPLRHPKVLGHAMLLAGTKPGRVA
ncbi:class I SAM-dependent methyltransferase [Actinoplanes sp. NPDC051513]|uniref:class I SAM-dependent methyltransferase n=1 Tax=Actinoplanes sp. NPDC051513 TaxID=3363908 RepID=UPI0037A2D58A